MACLAVAPLAAAAGEPIDYVAQIKPVLVARCYACHSALRHKSGLRLDTAQLLVQGGDGGPAIEPGHADNSLLIDMLTGALGTRMPPESEGAALTADELAHFRQWIDEGAMAPPEAPQADPRDHWAFHAPVRPAPPTTASAAWVRNPIDAFLAANYQAHGLTPAPPADKSVLLRRVCLDLTGLPPTRDELLAFESDESPQAYEAVVDHLLSSPRYGERWARHWMDVWRYSDWGGYKNEVRFSARHIWRWRDWIVESLNSDKGYDQMVVEMLAGDEVAPVDPDTLRATGFLARNWFKFNRNVWLDNTVEHTAKAFLGVTMNCCRCHDHKYDPINQSDYFAMRAIFEPHNVRTDRVPGQADVMKDGVARVFDAKPDEPTFLFVRGNDKQPDVEHPIKPGVPEVLGGKFEVTPIDLPVAAWYPALRDDLSAAELRGAARAVAALKTAEKSVDAKSPAGRLAAAKTATAAAAQASLAARLAAERAKYGLAPGGDASQLALAAGHAEAELGLRRAEEAQVVAQQELAVATAALKPNDVVARGKVSAAALALASATSKIAAAHVALLRPSSDYPPLGEQFPRQSTGRRLAFARWIANRQTPLAARVAVNHIWLRTFGAPLVDNMFDFGTRSPQARNQPLLDWLAVELMEHGWQLKHIQRLLVTSSAYRMQSGVADGAQAALAADMAADRDNRYQWRMNPRRLEAEAVRDALFHLAGDLDATLGGPDIACRLFATTPRRSIYLRHAYEKQAKFLELFDGASVNECYRRSESVVPQQALALANSDVSLDQSRLLAGKLAGLAAGRDATFIRFAFEQVLNREPTAGEVDESQKFLAAQTERLRDPAKLTPFAPDAKSAVAPSADAAQRARENLVHVLCNHNDFLTIH
jgi:hypothetical protein